MTDYPRVRISRQASPRIRLRVIPALVPLEVSLRNTGVMVQWRLGQGIWQDLIEIGDINASVAVGTVTTLPAGAPATVVNVGTPQDMILDFGIPEGIQGNAGTITIGTVTTVDPGDPATVTNVGTVENAILNFEIPQGEDSTVPGPPGVVQAIIAGTGMDVDNTDPANPIVNFDPTEVFTASVTEINYTDGVTSPIQTQIDGKQPLDADLTAIAGLVDPNADRILFWDDSAGTYAYLTPGTGLTIVGTTINASASGGSDADRHNYMLDAAYLAKVYGGARGGPGQLAIGFVAAGDINAGASTNADLDLTSGCVKPTVGTTTVSSPAANTTSPIGSFTMVDRSVTIPNSVQMVSLGCYSTVAQTFSLKTVKENSSTSYDILTTQSVVHAAGGWQDFANTSITPASGTIRVGWFAPAGATNYDIQTTGLRSYKTGDIGVSTGNTGFTADTSSVPVLRATYQSGFNNESVVTSVQSMSATVSTVRAVVEYDNAATPTLNTDLLVDVSCDNGANWTAATLTAVGIGQSGRRVAETADTVCANTGTVVLARIRTANNKNVPVYALTLRAH